MFELLKSIFGGDEKRGGYPEALVAEAIERAVDGTDPRLRALPGYRKRLRDPVLRAVDHVVDMVDSLPPPLSVAQEAYGDSALLRALFSSPRQMFEVFGSDAVLAAFRKAAPSTTVPVTALLLVEREEKQVLGMEMAGERVQRDVAQVAVDFRGPRLVGPAGTENETRRQLKCRAFDHLLSLALTRISDVGDRKAGLDRQRALLRARLGALGQAGWGFEGTAGESGDPGTLQRELESVDGQLAALGGAGNILQGHMEIVADVLTNAATQFWVENTELWLDRMNIRRQAGDGSGRSIRLQEIHNVRGRRLVARLLSIALHDVPLPEDPVKAAERYLGA